MCRIMSPKLGATDSNYDITILTYRELPQNIITRLAHSTELRKPTYGGARTKELDTLRSSPSGIQG
jgi:hypothetical protein